VVADGMGAHAAGELASKMSADAIPLVYRKRVDQSPSEAVLTAFLEANEEIHTRGQASRDFRGMGTTTTALLLLPAGALVAHVGDSRAYRLRGRRFEQLTFDHSLVWEVRASGKLPAGMLPGYISKNIITRSLGPSPTVKVDLEGPYPLQPGDTFLLCSDGLSGLVKDEEIGTVLQCLPPAEAVQALVDLACLRGGPDNITVVVARVLEEQSLQESAAEQPAAAAAPVARPVHPAVWTFLGATLLAAAIFLTFGYPLAALACFLVTGAAAVLAYLQRYGNQGDDQDKTDNRHFGRGPYVTCDAQPSAVFLGRLAEIDRQLRDAAESENWPVDWDVFGGLLAQAATAAETGDLKAATAGHLRAIMLLMAQLHRRQTDDDSGLFLLSSEMTPPPTVAKEDSPEVKEDLTDEDKDLIYDILRSDYKGQELEEAGDIGEEDLEIYDIQEPEP
jgi:protein phosphatase